MTMQGASISGGAREAYYDRAPSHNWESFETGYEAPHGSVSRAAYTVPASRKAYLEVYDMQVVRGTAASTPGQAGVMLRITDVSDASNNVVIANMLSTTHNTIKDTRYTTGGLSALLLAGDEFTYQTWSDGSGGTCWFKGTAKMLEFDG